MCRRRNVHVAPLTSVSCTGTSHLKVHVTGASISRQVHVANPQTIIPGICRFQVGSRTLKVLVFRIETVFVAVSWQTTLARSLHLKIQRILNPLRVCFKLDHLCPIDCSSFVRRRELDCAPVVRQVNMNRTPFCCAICEVRQIYLLLQVTLFERASGRVGRGQDGKIKGGPDGGWLVGWKERKKGERMGGSLGFFLYILPLTAG